MALNLITLNSNSLNMNPLNMNYIVYLRFLSLKMIKIILHSRLVFKFYLLHQFWGKLVELFSFHTINPVLHT